MCYFLNELKENCYSFNCDPDYQKYLIYSDAMVGNCVGFRTEYLSYLRTDYSVDRIFSC